MLMKETCSSSIQQKINKVQSTTSEINNDNDTKDQATSQNIVTITRKNTTTKQKNSIKQKTKMIEKMRSPSTYYQIVL